MGTPILDGAGRTVATESFWEDFWPYAYIDGYSLWFVLTRFNVTKPDVIEVECNFTDYTYGADRIYGRAALYYGGSQVEIVGNNSVSWQFNLSETVTPLTLGPYELRMKVTFDDKDIDGDPYVWDPYIRFRGEIHWPFNPPSYGCGNYWKGIAPTSHLVGLKVLNKNGVGFSSDIIKGVQWVIDNRTKYNITVMSLSLGGSLDEN